AHVTALTARHHLDGLLAFDDTGITGHPDHRAATAAAVLAGTTAGLPVLAWVLPAGVADQLRAETGHPFAGRPPGQVDFRISVDRASQRRGRPLAARPRSRRSGLWPRGGPPGGRGPVRWFLPPDPATASDRPREGPRGAP